VLVIRGIIRLVQELVLLIPLNCTRADDLTGSCTDCNLTFTLNTTSGRC